MREEKTELCEKEAEKILVSVVMPIYNAVEYLAEAIDNVLRQTMTEIELICVDDGSTDNSLSILKEYQQSDDNEILKKAFGAFLVGLSFFGFYQALKND